MNPSTNLCGSRAAGVAAELQIRYPAMRTTWGLLLMLFLTGCQWSENRYLDREVHRDEVIGKWVATDFAIESLRYAGHRAHLSREDHEIAIRPDGTCTFKSVMNVMLANPSGDPSYVETDEGCTWRIERSNDQSVMELDIQRSREQGIYYFFAEEHGVLHLWQYAADPDAWKYMEFVKVAG